MNIHEKVKIICKEKGILFKDLATKVGITDVGLRQSLKGNPSLSVLKRVALALGVEFWELLITDNVKQIFVCPHCGTRLHITLEEDSKDKETAATDKEKGTAAINKDKGTAATDSTENTSDDLDSALKEGLANF